MPAHAATSLSNPALCVPATILCPPRYPPTRRRSLAPTSSLSYCSRAVVALPVHPALQIVQGVRTRDSSAPTTVPPCLSFPLHLYTSSAIDEKTHKHRALSFTPRRDWYRIVFPVGGACIICAVYRTPEGVSRKVSCVVCRCTRSIADAANPHHPGLPGLPTYPCTQKPARPLGQLKLAKHALHVDLRPQCLDHVGSQPQNRDSSSFITVAIPQSRISSKNVAGSPAALAPPCPPQLVVGPLRVLRRVIYQTLQSSPTR